MNLEEKTYFIDNLKVMLDYWKLGQDEFGAKLGLKRNAVFAWTVSTKPSVPVLLEIEKMTGIPAFDLWCKNISKTDLPERPYGKTSRYEVSEPMAFYKKTLPGIVSKKELIDVSGLLLELADLKERVVKLEGKK